LKIHDQPKCARYCALSEKDRRTIRPEPILELIIESTRLSDPEVEKYLCFENYVVKCSILDETGKQDVSRKAEEEYRHPNLLVGSDVATASVVVNLDGGESCFFIFDDLSCRMQGSYRLKFDLVMINLRNRGTLSGAEKHRPFLATVTSDVFTTYSAGAFPGVGKRSELAHLLKAKG
ncbi:velvet factor, partial [Stachybotrys elegans]